MLALIVKVTGLEHFNVCDGVIDPVISTDHSGKQCGFDANLKAQTFF